MQKKNAPNRRRSRLTESDPLYVEYPLFLHRKRAIQTRWHPWHPRIKSKEVIYRIISKQKRILTALPLSLFPREEHTLNIAFQLDIQGLNYTHKRPAGNTICHSDILSPIRERVWCEGIYDDRRRVIPVDEEKPTPRSSFCHLFCLENVRRVCIAQRAFCHIPNWASSFTGSGWDVHAFLLLSSHPLHRVCGTPIFIHLGHWIRACFQGVRGCLYGQWCNQFFI